MYVRSASSILWYVSWCILIIIVQRTCGKKLRLLINSAKQQRLCKGHCIHSCLRIHWHYIQNEMGPEDQGRFGTVSYGFILHAE